MHIVQIHHEKVPVSGYGGTERVIEALCEAHIAAGHKVTLISYKGDYEIPGVNFIDIESLGHRDSEAKEFIKLIPGDADILHFHVAYPLDKMDLKQPYVMTLHGNAEDLSRLPIRSIGISQDHAKRHRCKYFVYNGLNFEDVKVGSALDNRNGFSFLGRASLKRKGLAEAKAIVKKLKDKLVVGGGRGISFGRVKYLGSVNNEEKYKFLSESKALLFPISWDEPFGLVMIEAMACGTPVFAFRRGSVPEVLGQKGGEQLFIIRDDVESMVKAIEEYDYSQISSEEIRAYVNKYFSADIMSANYRELYKKSINNEW